VSAPSPTSGRRRLDAVPPRIQAGRSLGLRDEAVVKDIMATIKGGDVSALPPIHLWRPLTPGHWSALGLVRVGWARCDTEVMS
jgi:hypothetical protein